MDEQEFKRRTKDFALHVIELAEELPKSRTAEVLGRQLVTVTVASIKTLRARK